MGAVEKHSCLQVYHKACFKCSMCNKSLDSTLVTQHEDNIYCKGLPVIIIITIRHSIPVTNCGGVYVRMFSICPNVSHFGLAVRR